jgi:DNA-binding MarR family transcriptional regulator
MNKYTKFKLCADLEANTSAKLLYLILLDLIDENNKIMIPQKKIGAALGLSRDTVSRNLRKLERIGAITIAPTYNDLGGQMANQYAVREG